MPRIKFLFRKDNCGSRNGLHKIHSVEYLGALSGHGPQVPSPLPLSFGRPKEELHSAGGAKHSGSRDRKSDNPIYS